MSWADEPVDSHCSHKQFAHEQHEGVKKYTELCQLQYVAHVNIASDNDNVCDTMLFDYFPVKVLGND